MTKRRNTWYPAEGQWPSLKTQLPEPTGWDHDRTDGPRCPYCGMNSLIRSYGDIAADDMRIEAYCTNVECEAREVIILANTRHAVGPRADLNAPYDVDRGPASPRNPRGWHMWTGSSLVRDDSSYRLRRRRGEHLECQCDTCQGRDAHQVDDALAA
jgi:hypothetical protein